MVVNGAFMCVAAVRREIQDETDRETGRSKQISSVPIHLSIYSPNGKSGFTLKYPYLAPALVLYLPYGNKIMFQMPFIFAFSHILQSFKFFLPFHYFWICLTFFWILAVVNLTLVDLPGLTKVAVGKCICASILRVGYPGTFFFTILFIAEKTKENKRNRACNLWTSIFLFISTQFSLNSLTILRFSWESTSIK